MNRKMTEIDCAISSSSASITGAVAAMAEPPQMEEPTPISVETLEFMWRSLYSRNDTIKDVVIVDRMMGSDCCPFSRISVRFMPNPRRMTAYCKIFFEVKAIPGFIDHIIR